MVSGATAAFPEPDFDVSCDEESLVVRSWSSRDPDLVRFFSAQLSEPEAANTDASGLFEMVCKAGVLALSTAQKSVDSSAVEREFDRLHQNLERVLEERVAQLQTVFEKAFDDETGDPAPRSSGVAR
jgi:hypothetical protein